MRGHHQALIAMLVLLGGCLADPYEDLQVKSASAATPCRTDIVSEQHCRAELQPDGTTAYVLSDLELAPPMPGWPALQASASEAHTLILRNLTIHGEGGAAAAISMACNGCRIIMENIEILGDGTGTGFQITGEGGTFTLRNVSTRHVSTGIHIRGDGYGGHKPVVEVFGATFRDCDTGLKADYTGPLHLEGLRAYGCQDYGAYLESPEPSVISGSVFEECDWGMRVQSKEGAAIEVRDSDFHGNHLAVSASGYGEIHFWGLNVTDNGEGLEGGGIATLASGSVHGSRFSGNAIALSTVGPMYPAEDNYWGDPVGPRRYSPLGPLGVGNGDAISGGIVWIPFRAWKLLNQQKAPAP